MNRIPRISVILISYNNLEYMKQALQSVLEQSYENIELIIADDGSDGFDKEKIEAYIKEHNCRGLERLMIYSNQVNQGTVKNINSALEYVTGAYVKILACDDVLFDKETLRHFVQDMKCTKANILTTKCQVYDAQLQKIQGYYPTHKAFKKLSQMSPHQLFRELMKGNAIGAVGICFKTEFLREIGGFDTNYRLLEDWPLWLKLTHENEKIHFIDRISVKYRLGGVCNEVSLINPILIQDMKQMYDKQILPYSKNQGYWIRKEVDFSYKRMFGWDKLSTFQKLKYCMLYIDIIMIRKTRVYLR